MLELILREWRLPVHERPSVMFVLVCAASADADQYDYRETLTNEFVSVEKLRSVLIISENFAKKFYTQQPIDLAFMQDGANTLQAGYAASPMQSAVGVFSAQFATNAAMSNGTPQLKPSAISVSVRTYGNPTQSYPEFYVYDVMLMATQIGMFDAVKWLSYLLRNAEVQTRRAPQELNFCLTG